jgi:acyl carrier protein
MNENGELLERLTEVFQNVFDDDELTITPETTAQDVEGWDSLTHVTLLINAERTFGVKFSSSEVASLKNVGELLDLIRKHSAGKH